MDDEKYIIYHFSEQFDSLFLTVLTNQSEHVKVNEKVFKGYNYKLMDVIHTDYYITNYYIDIDKSEIDSFIKSFGVENVLHTDVVDYDIPTNIEIDDSMYNTNDFRFNAIKSSRSYNRRCRRFYFDYEKYAKLNNMSVNLFTIIKREKYLNKVIISKTPMKDVI